MTTALYYTPSGRSIQEVGIQPDVEVHPDSPATGVLYRGVRERDLRGHISHDTASPDEADQLGEVVAESGSPEEPEAEVVEEPDADPEVEEDRDVLVARALEVLKSWTYFDRLSERKARRNPVAEIEKAPQTP